MTLQPEQTVLHYRIVEKIGEGGMGQVWRATDTTLDREVAIKVLPEAFAADAERLARFEQEAKLLASVNHPNIAAVYSVHEHAGTRFLAMELVEGEDLAARLARGPLPVDETARLAVQIAEALEVAHDSGVIHRDLKPANIQVTPAGKVKVLDFGLAKALAGPASGSDPALSPTLTSAGTVAGMILGTAGYMSPEQARGHEVDRRADVWAFGAVLYEMLTGRQAFGGGTVSDTLASVLKTEPDWAALPSDTPPLLRRMLRRALTKDAERRLPHVAGARLDLREWLDGTIEPEALLDGQPVQEATRPPAWQRAVPWALVVVLALAAAWMFVRDGTDKVPRDNRPVRLMALFPPGLRLPQEQMGAFALSADGRQMAMVLYDGTSRSLYLRGLEDAEFRLVPGSSGATTPFFSPDGRWVGFFVPGKIKKVLVAGGTPVNVCDSVGGNRGATWTADDRIVFSQHYTEPLNVVSASGGDPVALTTIDIAAGERTHRWPQAIPGTDFVLLTVGTIDSPNNYDGARIDVLRRSDGTRKPVLNGASVARYVPSGHLVYAREGFLFAAPFDLERLEMRGNPLPVVEDVLGVPESGAVRAAISDNGVLGYISGAPQSIDNSVVRRLRDGRKEPLELPAGRYSNPRLSPDGRRLAVELAGASTNDIWLVELDSMELSRLTFEGDNTVPCWSPDGRQILFGSTRHGGARSTFVMNADGSGEPRMVYDAARNPASGSATPDNWARDGMLALSVADENGYNVVLYDPATDEQTMFVASPFTDGHAVFSPDMRWLAYSSDDSGSFEVYVRPYPGPGRKRQISENGGAWPQWSSDGRKLFFRHRKDLLVATIDTDHGFRASVPEVVLDDMPLAGVEERVYTVASDGQAIYHYEPLEEMDPSPGITVILDWLDELERLVPVP